MNDLSQGSSVKPETVPPATITAGAVWQHIDTSPWPNPNRVQVKIIDAKDGWVRYYLCPTAPDQRELEDEFRARFESTDLYATGELLKAPVPRDELEGAILQMLEAYYYLAGQSNYAVRDAAIRRAQLAIGAKVTL